jgi:hypothetical protein
LNVPFCCAQPPKLTPRTATATAHENFIDSNPLLRNSELSLLLDARSLPIGLVTYIKPSFPRKHSL